MPPKRPIHAIDDERALIGGVLLAPRRLAELDRISATDFYAPAHAAIWSAMQVASERAPEFDALLVRAELARAGQADPTTLAALSAAEAGALSAANLTAYADAVLDAAIRRRILDGCERLTRRAHETDAQTLAAEAESLLAVADPGSRLADPISMHDAVIEACREIQAVRDGTAKARLRTGIPRVDEVTGGLGPGELAILAARPGIGKSALALQWAVQAARDGAGVLVFSAEMRATRLAMRRLAAGIKASLGHIKRGKLAPAQMDALARVAADLAGLPLWIADSTRVMLRDIQATTRRAKRRLPTLALVVVDYLQLVTGDGASRELEVGGIARGLKNLAMELDVSVLALSQLNRESEKARRRPVLSDLRESGEIEQAADAVFFIHREPDAIQANDEAKSIPAELVIAKAREGDSGVFAPLTFFSAWTVFGERTEAPQLPGRPWRRGRVRHETGEGGDDADD
jgi:replicative DNA helicase